MTVERIEKVIIEVSYHWICDKCGYEDDFVLESTQRGAEVQHNSPRKSSMRGGVNRSPCEANRIDAVGLANL